MNSKIIDTNHIIELLRQILSKKRYKHSLNVAEEAKKLARFYGGNVDKCYLAGLLHDIMKEETPHAMKSQALLNPIPLEVVEEQTPALWHAPASAFYAMNKLEITDMEIIGAVRWHTAGKPAMNLTEKIVYLADLISADREYEDVAIMRKISYTDMDYAMYVAMKFAIDDVIQKDGLLANCSVLAYNYYQKFNKKENL